MNQQRSYSSPLRQRQTEDTRRLILDTALAMIQEKPQEPVAHEEIAKRAEVGLRTVYRYFPSRTELLDAVWQESDRKLGLTHYPETEEELMNSLESVYRRMDENGSLIRGLLISNAGAEMRRRDNERRRTGVMKALEDATSHLSNDERRRVVAVFQSLYSARTWEMMRDRAHLNEGETAQAVRWALETMLRALREQQRTPSSAKAPAVAPLHRKARQKKALDKEPAARTTRT